MLTGKNLIAAVLLLTMMLTPVQTCCAEESISDIPEESALSAALFSYIPDPVLYEESVRKAWEEVHPEIPLRIVKWDCYYEEIPEDLDVFVFDSLFLPLYVSRGELLEIPEEKIPDAGDFVPFALEGCCSDGKVYAVPELLCTSLLYTRKEDAELSGVSDLVALYDIIGDRADDEIKPAGREGLLVSMVGETTKANMFLDALSDAGEPEAPADGLADMVGKWSEAYESLQLLCSMGGLRQVLYVPEDGDEFARARWFAEGRGRALIGYTEAMSVMGEALDEIRFQPFSYTGEKNVPLYSADAVGIASDIEESKKEAAYDLMNVLAGEAVMVGMNCKETEETGDGSVSPVSSQYLLPARISAYKKLSSDFPLYEDLLELALNPDNELFQLGPDVKEFIEVFGKMLSTAFAE